MGHVHGRFRGYMDKVLGVGISASEMTYIVSSGALNSTHSLTGVGIPTGFSVGMGWVCGLTSNLHGHHFR